MEEHSSWKGEGSPLRIWIWVQVLRVAVNLWASDTNSAAGMGGICIPRHDAMDLKDQEVMVKYGHKGHQMHCSMCTLDHGVMMYGTMGDRLGGARCKLVCRSWMRVCFLMCCINALCKSCSVPAMGKRQFLLNTAFWKPNLWEETGWFNY